MAIQNISPQEAKDLLESDLGYVYVDVRSEFEFEQGHPAPAINIPIKQLNQSSKMLEDNPDFLAVLAANFPVDTKLIIGCAAGPRSAEACRILAQQGYQDLANVEGGFGGMRDMAGTVIKEGWMQLGFPVESGDGGAQGYSALKKGKE
ncbi:MAG: rhodanese-like domain-containing protein [Caldithrix sp.]|nr:MAG: rhodanese-like domain-containing protein [Caldithrix sp.]